MRALRVLALTIFLFFLFHQTTFSPISTLVSADVGATTSQVVKQANWGELVTHRAATASIRVPTLSQLPELYNGCEVTSLSMLLTAAGKPVDKIALANQLTKDPTPLKTSSQEEIVAWGDPDFGFVGDITGQERGYGVNSGPIYNLLRSYFPDTAVDLKGVDYSILEWMINKGNPVVVWTTTTFSPTDDWVDWKKDNKTIHATFREHVVLMVGYDEQSVYVNDPLTGERKKINKQQFIQSWNQLGRQAVSLLGEKAYLALQE